MCFICVLAYNVDCKLILGHVQKFWSTYSDPRSLKDIEMLFVYWTQRQCLFSWALLQHISRRFVYGQNHSPEQTSLYFLLTEASRFVNMYHIIHTWSSKISMDLRMWSFGGMICRLLFCTFLIPVYWGERRSDFRLIIILVTHPSKWIHPPDRGKFAPKTWRWFGY